MAEITTRQLENIARQTRGRLVKMSHDAGAPHLGSSLSCVDLVVAAYWDALRIDPNLPNDPDRDRFILSKGHAAPTLYVALAMRGFFPMTWLDRFAEAGGPLAEQPCPTGVPGIEAATGSLGHGLPIGVGIALAGRLQSRDYLTVALMSDGECNEGSVWEAAMFAAGQRLDRLAVVIDYNKWQATGRSDEVMALAPLNAKWEAFGWSARELDGHDMDVVRAALNDLPDGSGKPVAVIAHTVKGKGVSFMEDDNNWHYRIPTAEEAAHAARELDLA